VTLVNIIDDTLDQSGLDIVSLKTTLILMMYLYYAVGFCE